MNPESARGGPSELRILVFAPRGRDAGLTVDLLGQGGLTAHVCVGIDELCEAISAGAAAAIVSEEALDPRALQQVATVISEQPSWSDFPFVLFGDRALLAATSPNLDRAFAALGNVTLLDRPVRVRTMLTAVRAALRARLRQYEARRAIHSRDQFLAMLGHELRNPLAAIRMAIELMDRSAGELDQERQRAVIDRQSQHLARLVDDLLDVARVTYGKVTLLETEIDIGEVIASVVQGYTQRAEKSALRMVVRARGKMLTRGDRTRLEQIFGNLVANAIKYTPAGGTVTIDARPDSGDALVRVTDTGIGIETAMLPKVFDLFAQADQGLVRSEGGMGLGLTLVRSLVRLHRGEVRVASEGIGCGSEFTVRLPLSTSSGAAPPARPRRPADSEMKTVVLVDDSDDLREMFEQLLQMDGHMVHSAIDGPDGVALILKEEPQFAFVDIGLPGFDGYEVARRVRAGLGRQVRLVAMTGYGQDDDRRRAQEAGFDHHLTKPVAIEDLRAVLRGAAPSATR